MNYIKNVPTSRLTRRRIEQRRKLIVYFTDQLSGGRAPFVGHEGPVRAVSGQKGRGPGSYHGRVRLIHGRFHEVVSAELI